MQNFKWSSAGFCGLALLVIILTMASPAATSDQNGKVYDSST